MSIELALPLVFVVFNAYTEFSDNNNCEVSVVDCYSLFPSNFRIGNLPRIKQAQECRVEGKTHF